MSTGTLAIKSFAELFQKRPVPLVTPVLLVPPYLRGRPLVDVVLGPDSLKALESVADFVLFLQANGDNKGVDKAERGGKGIDERSHITAGGQQVVGHFPQRGSWAVGDSDNGCAGVSSKAAGTDSQRRITREADANKHIFRTYPYDGRC